MMNKKKPFEILYKKYLKNDVKLKLWQKEGVVLLVMVIAGFVGWLWEFCLQEVSGGFQHLYIKGGGLLPWINIYAYGAVLVILTTYRLRQRPLLVFLVSAVVCGVLELFAGWVVYVFENGARYWNYLNSWWGVGSINGFVCPASVCLFGLGALALIYWLLPHCIYWSQRMSKRVFLGLAVALFALVVVDELTNLTLRYLDLPTARNLYEWMGWKYLNK